MSFEVRLEIFMVIYLYFLQCSVYHTVSKQ
jgi:hypothetical protein